MDSDNLSDESIYDLFKAIIKKGTPVILNKNKFNISANNRLKNRAANITVHQSESSSSQSQSANQVPPASDRTYEPTVDTAEVTRAFSIQTLKNGTNVVQQTAPGPGQFDRLTDFVQREFCTLPGYAPGPFGPGAILRVTHEASPELRTRIFCVLNTTEPDPRDSDSMAAIPFCRHSEAEILANERYQRTHMRAYTSYNGELKPHRGELNLHLDYVKVSLTEAVDLKPDIWLDIRKIWDLSNSVQCAQIGSLTDKALKYVQREMWKTYAPHVFGPQPHTTKPQ